MCGLPAVNFLHKALEQDANDTPLHAIAIVSSYQHWHRVNDWQQMAVSAALRRDNAESAQNSALETSLIY